jgi:hypothetical protein
MPYTIYEVELPEAEKRCDKVLFKILLTLNIIFPVLEIVTNFFSKSYEQKETTQGITWLYYSILYFVSLLQFLSGYFLMQSLKKIRNFIVSR